MPHRIDLVFAAARIPHVWHHLIEHQQRIAHLFLARLIPVGHLKAADAAGPADLDRILQGLRLLDVLRIGRIDQRAHRSEKISCADLLSRVRVISGRVDGLQRVVVLIDHHQRHETLAGIGQRDRHRPRIGSNTANE